MNNENERKPIETTINNFHQLKNSEYIGHWDLPEDGSSVKVTLKEVAYENPFNPATNKREKKTTVSFEKRFKRLILNATNMKNIASHHGPNPQKWPGKEVELFRTTTKVKGETVECVRVKPSGKAIKESANKAASAAE